MITDSAQAANASASLGYIDLNDEPDEQFDIDKGACAGAPPLQTPPTPGTDRYVDTRQIKAAVLGQENSILDAIGIRWDRSRGHIDCPYPDHRGRADWRWDDNKHRAFCSCIGRRTNDKKAHSIFDVVALIKGCTFEGAKVEVAGIIGRPDLIKTKGGQQNAYTRTDATSLLSPPDAKRADWVGQAYLAARLGVAPHQVSRPTTPIAGWTQLDYFDAPAKENGKPVLVGTAPCAVFGQVGADGATHAHRIYLSPDATRKADFGSSADGSPRDPKKSARKVDDRSTAGRAVLWGNPVTATATIVTEGIETGAAVALAFQAEVAEGRLLVAAAISAAGMEAFRTWPACEHLIAAADRDEGVKADGRQRERTGELAARKCCARQAPVIKCLIALPGQPGEKVDWLDVLVRDGVHAVRSGIETAVPFVVSAEETEAELRRHQQQNELDEIEAMYPLPRTAGFTLRYARVSTGKIMVHRLVRRGEEIEWVSIASPFGVTARMRNANQQDAYGLRLIVQDMAGNPRAVDFDRGRLARMGAADIREQAFKAGLRTVNDGEDIIVRCLKAADPEREIVIVDQPGWHDLDGLPDPVFVAPDGTVYGAPPGVDLELAAAQRLAPDIARGGKFEDWREAVRAAAAVKDCQHWAVGVLSGFAGSVLGLAQIQSCGINFSGMSSSGKSTAQALAVSSWSTPKLRADGLFQSANTTVNSFESLAQKATGTVLALDDLSHLSGKELEQVIYTTSAENGRKRMTSDAMLRSTYHWSTFAILSSENSIEEKIRADGGTFRAGMAVRIPDIDVSGVNRTVDPDTMAAIRGIEQNFGHAGPAFVQAIVNQGYHRDSDTLRRSINEMCHTLACSDCADEDIKIGTATNVPSGSLVRAAMPFALLHVAGTLAKEFGILPENLDVHDTVRWAWQQFRSSSDAVVLDPVKQFLGNTREWIQTRWGVSIKNVQAPDGVNNRDADGWYDRDAVYIPTSQIVKAAGGALTQTQIGKILRERGLLAKTPEPDRNTVSWVPKVGAVAAYALKRQQFGRQDQDLSPPSGWTAKLDHLKIVN